VIGPESLKAYFDAIPAAGWSLLSSIVGVLGTLGAVLVTHWLGRNKATREKVWEKKVEVYSSLLEMLRGILRDCEGRLEDFQQYGQYAYTRKDDAPKDGPARPEFWQAVELVSRHSLLLSRDFNALWGTLVARVEGIEDADIPPDWDLALSQAISAALPELRRQAEREVRR
jgi:hypothetical protein